MPGIFISYRRLDSQSAAGRLADHLNEHLRGATLFRDVEAIEPGVDFVEAIERALSGCAVMLVVIGPRWVSVSDAAGQRRLDDPNDYTRLEVATALKRNVRVVPVLVEGAVMPTAEQLPEDLKPLARRNAIELTDSRWSHDVHRLVTSLEKALGMGTGGGLWLACKRHRWVALLLAVLLAGGGLYGLKDTLWPVPEPQLLPVPELIGASEQEALARLRAAGLTLAGVQVRVTVGVPPGQVVEQSPAPGMQARPGSGVRLVLAEAPPEAPRGPEGPMPTHGETPPAPPPEPPPAEPTAPAVVGRPDLTVSLEGPARAVPGEDIGERLALVVHNRGDASAPGTMEAGRAGYMVDLVLTRQRTPAVRQAAYAEGYSDGALLRGGRVSRTRTLEPGQESAYRAGALIAADTPAGEYCLGAVVDSGKQVRERDEDNNTACQRIHILRPQADLAIVRFTLSPSPPTQGRPVSVRVGVTNRGDAPSGQYAVAWWPGENYPEPGCRWDGLPSLPPGATKGLSCNYPGYPSWYGRIRTKVEIDVGDDGAPDDNRTFQEIQVLRP